MSDCSDHIYQYAKFGACFQKCTNIVLMVYSVPTGQVVPTSVQVVDSTCECSGVSTTDFYQFTCDLPVRPSFRLSDGHEGQEVVSNF